MRFQVDQLESVDYDLEQALHYYNQFNLTVSKNFLLELEKASKALEINPFFEIKYKNVRTLKIKRFPYLIHFVIEEEKNQVVIIAIVFGGFEDQDYSGRGTKAQ